MGATVAHLITLSQTGRGRDGQWFGIRHDGWFFAEVRTCAQLCELVNLPDLRES